MRRGGACADGADGVCLTDWDGTVFPGGTCAIDAFVYCCPDGAGEAASEDGETLYCLKTCTADADCRGLDYTCSAGKFCFPP